MKKLLSLSFIFLLTIVSAEAAKGPGKFYLTKGSFTGAQALTACAAGYHMASLWEIFETSNFKYDTTLGLTQDDSGSGPPAGVWVGIAAVGFGWIRTGVVSTSTDGIPVLDNCFAWSSNNSSDNGTVVGLNSYVESPNFPVRTIDRWTSLSVPCNSTPHVWCVQD